ncbi:hypothetical protein AC480_05915 [miscellaneous Crenarchaeota group archaeon SMTZ1-55]|nr:MAG: hypothetical protein AC480_05915 [miscellaneous Crenarchaeota group archaeon SMTZ1-55]
MGAGRIFISDCEGPISKNDNAFEVTQAFIPGGAPFYALISRYDDVLADVIKPPGYRAGNTLKLIAPFLKAYGVTNETMVEFAAQTLVVLPGAREMLSHLTRILPSFIVSTSYEQYLAALCAVMDFPVENTYCTRLDLDRYDVPPREAARLKEIQDEIASYPMIDIPDDAESLQDFAENDQAVIERLDTVFWEELPGMTCGRMLEDITPVGGEAKARVVMEIVATLESALSDVVYVGDSITDVQALQRVKEGGGVAISFNGNRYAVKNAEIAVLSDNALVTSVLVDVFYRRGKKAVLELARRWSHGVLKTDATSNALIESLLKQVPHALPQVRVVDEADVEELVGASNLFRKKVRGEAIGRLG